MTLLFAASARPDATAIRSLSLACRGFAISHDPAPDHTTSAQNNAMGKEGAQSDTGWLEVLADGLTFDLTGLDPAPGQPLPECGYRFDLAQGWDLKGLEAVRLVPGPHLMAGARMMPVVRAMAGLAAHLCGLPGLVAVAWHPSRSCIGPRYFCSIIENWLEGGVFPGLGLVGLINSADGGLQSEGLAFFIGQELRIEPELAEDRAGAAKIAVRLIDRLIEHGKLDKPEVVTGSEGRVYQLEPSANGRFIRVWMGP